MREADRLRSNTDRHLRRTGYAAFIFHGACAFSSGIVVSMLQERYGFAYGMTGTLLSCVSIGNMIASFVCGMLTEKIGMRRTALTLSLGHAVGYAAMAFCGLPGVLLAAFLMVGIAKGTLLNTCTVLVGNHAEDRPKAMTIMHCFAAIGATLTPFLLAALSKFGTVPAILGVSACGGAAWIIFAAGRLPGKETSDGETTATARVAEKTHIDFSFLRQPQFWLLAALLFCQQAAEQGVNGWLVTYFKDQGILTGVLSTYTVSIMWGATLAGRLVVAFALKIRNVFRVLTVMGLGCIATYLILMQMTAAIPAVTALFCFAFAMAGVNPLTVAAVGEDLSPASAGILLPIGGIGAIVMPYVIGIFADSVSLFIGMAMNLMPCAGILAFSLILLMRSASKSSCEG